jgi:branched-chain amino acid aminotransferase
MVKELAFIWMDGKFVNWHDANCHILTHTLHYGSGVFEGIRCYKTQSGPAIFRMKEHIERLFNSAKIMKINVPYRKEQLVNATKHLIKVNRVKECYIRPIIYYGYGPMGLNTVNCPVSVAIIIWPWGAYLGKEGLEKGIKVKVSNMRRETCSIAYAKACGNYIKSILAKRDAVEHGYDEAVMLDDKGFVAEGSGENIFIVKNNVIKTPKLGAILPGITRDSIIRIARDLDYTVEETQFKKEDLYMADEAFFTGTAAEITPIKRVDNKIIGIGKRGKITKQLQEKFFDIVKGRDEKYEELLTYVK